MTLGVALVAGVGLAQAEPPEVESPVPDFTLLDVEGEPHTLSERVGAGPVVLVFFRGAW